PTAQAFNRRAARGDGPPRPGEPGHDPRLGHDRLPPPLAPSPAVPLPAQPGPPGYVGGQPFAAGPQLRPLYDANPAHRGTGALLPMDPGGPIPPPRGLERPPLVTPPAPGAPPPAPLTPIPPGAPPADQPPAGAPPPRPAAG